MACSVTKQDFALRGEESITPNIDKVLKCYATFLTGISLDLNSR